MQLQSQKHIASYTRFYMPPALGNRQSATPLCLATVCHVIEHIWTLVAWFCREEGMSYMLQLMRGIVRDEKCQREISGSLYVVQVLNDYGQYGVIVNVCLFCQGTWWVSNGTTQIIQCAAGSFLYIVLLSCILTCWKWVWILLEMLHFLTGSFKLHFVYIDTLCFRKKVPLLFSAWL